MIEHLTGPDVKVIELSHPLYPSHDNDKDDNNDEDDDEDDDDDDDDEDSNDDNENDDDNSSNNVNGTEYLEKYKEDDVKNNAESVATVASVATEANVDDSNFSITAVFKPKESDTNPDLNSMNVQGLRQLLKQRMASDGKQMSETSINKLTKKDLIKQLHQ